MLPILSAENIRAADKATMEAQGIASIELMERAAVRCTDRILHHCDQRNFGFLRSSRFLVIAGPGNNGGDGLAIARLLHSAGIAVRVMQLKFGMQSPDNAANAERLIGTGISFQDIEEPADLELNKDEVVIDALFGTGLKKPITGWLSVLVKQLNSASNTVIAIDMPSGLFAEHNSNDHRSIVQADLTLTFEVPKRAMLLAENETFLGKVEVIPIGLDQNFIASLPVKEFLVREKDAIDLLPPRSKFDHKGNFGHALIIAGSSDKAGAAVLAVRSALRSGVGLVTAHVPGSVVPIMHASAPEAMCSIDPSRSISDLPKLDQFTAIGIGPGLEVNSDNELLVKYLIQSTSSNLILDADALNILSANKTWLSFLPKNSILTPHPKEFDRLSGERSLNGSDRLNKAREMSIKLGVIIILKGAHTAICSPAGQVFFNSTGNPGMAKGGSGDALTGLLTGLLAQGLQPLQASILGVFLHGRAGDLAAESKGQDGMIVSDLIENLADAWKLLRDRSEHLRRGTFAFADHAGFSL